MFENRTLDVNTIIANSLRLAREWQGAQTTNVHKTGQLISTTTPPLAALATTHYTLHTDAAWRAQDKTAGCGWILYNPQGQVMKIGTSTELCVATPLMAEALAVREALLHAKALHLFKICIKSDNQLLVKALISKQHPVEIYGINLDIEKLSTFFSSVSFVYVSRTLNSAADELAKTALYHQSF